MMSNNNADRTNSMNGNEINPPMEELVSHLGKGAPPECNAPTTLAGGFQQPPGMVLPPGVMLKPPKDRFPIFDGMKLPTFPSLVKDAEGRFNQIKNLKTCPDDILLTAYPRSGTHWLWEILFMLKNGKAEYTKEVKETAFLEFIEDFESLNRKPSPRVINTHVPYRWLPAEHKQNGGKIVHAFRNPKDVMVSSFFFAKSVEPHLKEMPWPKYFQLIMKDKEPMYGGWFNYEKEMEEARKENNAIISLCYEELKRNPTVEIKRLADFLGVVVSTDLIKEIADKCSFGNLKNADETLKDTELTKDFKHYRKGETGDWRNYFTDEQNEQFDAVYNEEMKNSKLKVQFG